MFGSSVVALIYAGAAIVGAYFLKPRTDEFPPFIRIFVIWLGVAVCGFLLPTPALSITAIAILIAVAAPIKPVDRVCVFLATFMAAPTEFMFEVPFPGLNYLVSLNQQKLSAIILLLPCLLYAFRSKVKGVWIADWMVVAFYLIASVMSARELPLTSVLREMFDLALVILLPYFVISRTLRTREDFSKAFAALFVGIMILAAIGLVSGVRTWNFYEPLNLQGPQFADFRGGMLRVSATLMTTLLATVMGLGIAAALEYGRKKTIGRFRTLAYLAAFGGALLLTGSRGGILAAAIGVVTYFVFARMGAAMRTLYVVGGIAFLVLGPIIFFNVQFDQFDPYGTFQYREDLFKASMLEFSRHPLLGSPNYASSDNFAHLVQGQGIVDFVNAYIQIVLGYGIIGLGAFLLAALSLTGACMKTAGLLGRAPETDSVRQAQGQNALILAGLVSLLVMMATVSAISYVNHYIFMFFALAVATTTYARAVASDAMAAPAVDGAKASIDPAEALPEATASKPQPSLPPHLRQYVRDQ